MDELEEERKRLGRRELLAGGVALLALGVGAGLYATCAARKEQAGEPMVFRHDAPQGHLWEAWKRRGWVREARHYHHLGRNVQCHLCPNECLLEPEDRSHCRNKVHKEGKLFTLAYGNPVAFHLDPIEKKPLFHYLPGAQAFSIATSGCSFRCLNCQNWELSQKTPEELKVADGPELRATPGSLRRLAQEDLARLSMLPEDVVEFAAGLNAESIAYTYSEPISYFEYMLDTARLARKRGIKNLWITNGYIKREPLIELTQVIDAANVNLKSFSEKIHFQLNQGHLAPVLETLKLLKERGVWLEVTNLIVPTYTDSLELIREMCGFIAKELGPEQPIHLSRFRPEYRLAHLPPTPLEILREAREIARSEGLLHVYLGNAAGIEDGSRTVCAGCRATLIEREGFRSRLVHLKNGSCDACGRPLPGIWRAT